MTTRGALLALGILAAFLAVFVPLALRVIGGRDATIDAERMRRTYVALALYEGLNDGLPAPNLGLVRLDVEPTDLQSVGDPKVGDAGDFPLDPALPSLPLRSRTRVSWTYRWHWPNAGDPAEIRLDGTRGLLASWWLGSTMRINIDGALTEAPGGKLVFRDLFGR